MGLLSKVKRKVKAETRRVTNRVKAEVNRVEDRVEAEKDRVGDRLEEKVYPYKVSTMKSGLSQMNVSSLVLRLKTKGTELIKRDITILSDEVLDWFEQEVRSNASKIDDLILPIIPTVREKIKEALR